MHEQWFSSKVKIIATYLHCIQCWPSQIDQSQSQNFRHLIEAGKMSLCKKIYFSILGNATRFQQLLCQSLLRRVFYKHCYKSIRKNGLLFICISITLENEVFCREEFSIFSINFSGASADTIQPYICQCDTLQCTQNTGWYSQLADTRLKIISFVTLDIQNKKEICNTKLIYI